MLRLRILYTKLSSGVHSFFFHPDGRFKTISFQMRASKTMKLLFLFLSYLVSRLAATATTQGPESYSAYAAGSLLAAGILIEGNPVHAVLCISAALSFLYLLHAKQYYTILGIYSILFAVLLCLWLFSKRTDNKMGKVVEMHFGALEWALTLLAIGCGLWMAAKDKQGMKGVFFPFI